MRLPIVAPVALIAAEERNNLSSAKSASPRSSSPAVEAKNGMVVTSQDLASQVGVDILQMGGNAIDAAVAVGYAQAVVNPCCGNIGGGGFMTVHLADGKDTFINFRETAPAAASANMYLDADGNVKKAPACTDISRRVYRAQYWAWIRCRRNTAN